MNCKPLLIVAAIACFTAYKKHDIPPFINEDASSFAEIGSIDIGAVGAAEITAYDPKTKRLFTGAAYAESNYLAAYVVVL